MLLILKFNRRKPEHQLKRAGYIKRRWGDWIFKETDGRWHVIELQKGVYSIHFDLNVGDKHYAPKMPIKTKQEIARINRNSVTTRLPLDYEYMEFLFNKYRGH